MIRIGIYFNPLYYWKNTLLQIYYFKNNLNLFKTIFKDQFCIYTCNKNKKCIDFVIKIYNFLRR